MILYATGNIPVFCVRKLFFSQGIKVLFNFLKLSYFKNVHGNNSNKHCWEFGATSCDVAALRYYVIVYILLLRYFRRH